MDLKGGYKWHGITNDSEVGPYSASLVGSQFTILTLRCQAGACPGLTPTENQLGIKDAQENCWDATSPHNGAPRCWRKLGSTFSPQ